MQKSCSSVLLPTPTRPVSQQRKWRQIPVAACSVNVVLQWLIYIWWRQTQPTILHPAYHQFYTYYIYNIVLLNYSNANTRLAATDCPPQMTSRKSEFKWWRTLEVFLSLQIGMIITQINTNDLLYCFLIWRFFSIF